MSVLTLCLTSDDARSVRGMVGPDGVERWSVYDFINAVCGKEAGNTYANTVFCRLVKDGSEHKMEVTSSCSDLKFPGRGQRDTPTMTLRGLQRLLMILGGKVAAEYRALVEGTFTRVMAGDRSLIQVIEANAASTSPVQQAFQRALASEPADAGLERVSGVKRDRWDNLRFIKESTELYSHICADTHMDERARLFFKDSLMNQLMLEDKPGQASTPLTISTVAAEMGLSLSTLELQSVGHDVVRAYKAKHGEAPAKHEQLCGGAIRKVNSYTQTDRALVEAALLAKFRA